jgi:hypothetical protein
VPDRDTMAAAGAPTLRVLRGLKKALTLSAVRTRAPIGIGEPKTAAIMTTMADRQARSGGRDRRAQQRLRTLAQAALNADVTVGQVDAVLSGVSETLVDLNSSTGNLDATLERFNATISRIDELASKLIGVVERLEAIVDRVERMVEVGEAVVSPFSATESAVRGMVSAVRNRTGL